MNTARAADYIIRPTRKPVLLETIRRSVPADDGYANVLNVDDDLNNLE